MEQYHIYNRSIAEYVIFKQVNDFTRMLQTMQFYQRKNQQQKLSAVLSRAKRRCAFLSSEKAWSPNERLVDILTYCLMPTHFHFNLLRTNDNDITQYIQLVCNSYSRYFNTKYKRKGPLWESHYKKVRIVSDEQLLHLTRYIHLNPVTAYLVNKPEDWPFSSYNEYTAPNNSLIRICHYADFIDLEPHEYREFVESGIQDQRERAKIKEQI